MTLSILKWPALAAAVVISIIVAVTVRAPTPPKDDGRIPHLQQR